MSSEAIVTSKVLVVLEVKFDLRFDASNPNYLGIYVHVTWNSHYGGL